MRVKIGFEISIVLILKILNIFSSSSVISDGIPK